MRYGKEKGVITSRMPSFFPFVGKWSLDFVSRNVELGTVSASVIPIGIAHIDTPAFKERHALLFE